jgi:outer membrane protein assembly factor BamB
MHSAKELRRQGSPAGRPQPLAFAGGTLWVGCWDTSHLYAIDPATWRVTAEVAAPGMPYGIASLGGVLRVVVSIGAEDDRFLYRFVPGQGFDAASKTACPELTGSHLASDGSTLYLLQMANRCILALDSDGSVLRQIALSTRCAGIGFAAGAFHMIAADEEFENLELATLDVSQENPNAVPVAALPPEARGLTFDGTAWWTSHREANEIVSFTL